jgi:flavodoxin
MKALILFRSFHGNTKKAAEAMSRGIASLGHEAVLHDLRRRQPDLADIHCVLIGAPTRMGRVTRRAYRAIKRLRKKGIGEKPVAVFDTYGPVPTNAEELKKAEKWLNPGAVGRMREKAQELGLNVYPKILRCEVQGMKGPLKEGEAEKAAAFAKEFMAETFKG